MYFLEVILTIVYSNNAILIKLLEIVYYWAISIW